MARFRSTTRRKSRPCSISTSPPRRRESRSRSRFRAPSIILTLTPSSDSSLNYNDIISLLVTGRPPTSDPALLSGQNALGPGAFQQLGASALLGQAISAPVTGRLQRFFGVSSLRIDPTIPGIDANPQARLTLQQQVTPNVTLHLHYERHDQQSANRAGGMGAEQHMVGSGAAGRERHDGDGFLL